MMSEEPTTVRVDALDWLRAFAVVQMVQGHTLDALLDVSLRNGLCFEAWRWSRGITAPAFLFCAGYAFVLAYARRPAAVGRRMRRAALLIALGYALRTPWLSLLRGDVVGQDAIDSWLLVDVLQCIGVSIALLEASMRLRPRSRQTLYAFVVVICVAAGPHGLVLPLPVWVANYFGQRTLFALLPWVGHVAVGALLAELRSDRRGSFAVSSLALIACGAAFDGIVRGSSAHGLRMVTVLALFALFGELAPYARDKTAMAARYVSASSLFVYVMHIVIVYAAELGLASRPGPVLSLSASLGYAFGLLALCLLARSVWETFHARMFLMCRQAAALFARS